MKKFVLLVLTLLLLCFAAQADSTLTFTQGVQLELFNENDVRVYLTGEVDASSGTLITLPAVIENKTDHPICVSWTGTGNGWSISRGAFGNSGSNVAANAKAKTFLWFQYDELDIKRFSELESVTLTFSVEEPATSLLAQTEAYFTVDNVTIDFAGGGEPVRALEYYEESPSLPIPTSYVDVYQSGSGSSSINGKLSSIRYSYRPSNNGDKISDILNAYVSALRDAGYAISGSGSSYIVKNGRTELATVSDDGIALTVELVPGNEKVTQLPASSGSTSSSSSTAASPTAAPITTSADGEIQTTVPATEADDGDFLLIGDTINTATVRMTLEKKGTADTLYSYLGSQPRTWSYYEAQSGNQLFYIQGKVTNIGGKTIDFDNICMEATFDDKYTYFGQSSALQADGRAFTDDITAQSTMNYYIFFEVPKTVLNSYKTCIIKLGFTDAFSTIVKVNGSYRYSMCDDVFEIDVSKNPQKRTSAAASSQPVDTANFDPTGYWRLFKRVYADGTEEEIPLENNVLQPRVFAPNGWTVYIYFAEGLWSLEDGEIIIRDPYDGTKNAWINENGNFIGTDTLKITEDGMLLLEFSDFGVAQQYYARCDECVLAEYTDKETIKNLQAWLDDRGYPCKADGNLGKKTAAQITKFQQDNALTVTGTFTVETMLALEYGFVLP